MKVLWIVNLVLPKVSHLIGDKPINFGGWVTNMLNQLESVQDYQIGVVMRAPIQKTIEKKIDNIQYYIIPQSKNDKFDVYDKDCVTVLNSFKPDLLHVEGSESAQALRFLRTWPGENVVSMQGIINGYKNYELGGLSLFNDALSVRDYLDIISLMVNKVYSFSPRLNHEKKTLSLAKNILGRTHWDKSHAYFLNRNAPYFICNRILRKSFYENKWDINDVKKYRIFIGNSAQARKGFHIVLEAVSLLKDEYPDIEIVVTGHKPSEGGTFNFKNHIGYRSYISRKIESLELVDKIKFLGVIDEKQMIMALKESHVFVMSSIIENSPNTLGEAMILGMPCISAYMGGVSDMAKDGESALFYRTDDPIILAMRLKSLFDNDVYAKTLGENAKETALETHDPEKNVKLLLDAYSVIMGK